MKLPRVRIPVRWLMVVVAIVGFVTEGLESSAEYSRRAERFERWLSAPFSAESGSPSFHARRRHFHEMARKYRRAAWLPWLPVEPDPPVPK
jgi:hypothetical protein